ncbi:MAG TPA: type II secretion system protein GspD, partial [Synergistales bacterium]|nr:type II secretion system protein GspD [Synergistales bacterium]
PGLSYIPLVGNLFKSSTKQREKIELMVFLTPYILETPSEAEEFTQGIVLSGQYGMSEAEKKIQERLEKEYRDILSRESR